MNKKGLSSIIIIIVGIFVISLISLVFYFLPSKGILKKLPPVKLETINASCQKDTDCVLAKTNQWLSCDRGPCKKDYTENDYLAVNKNWQQEKTMHCTNSFPACKAEDAFLPSDSFIAKCVHNQCQKTTKPFEIYVPPKIPRKEVYTIFLIGDSMTLALGPHGGTFNTFIHQLYSNDGRKFQIDNYASGSTNILALNKMMTSTTTYWDSTFEPLLSRKFDLILVESFAYNPLSEFGLEEGLKRQTIALDGLMKNLITTHPEAAVVFVATISPNKKNYAIKIHPSSTAVGRAKEAEERIAYLKNHIAYASSHHIPVINIFEKSLNSQGDGDLSYINPDDYIHPSFKGVDFIGHEIANFIYDNQILPR